MRWPTSLKDISIVLLCSYPNVFTSKFRGDGKDRRIEEFADSCLQSEPEAGTYILGIPCTFLEYRWEVALPDNASMWGVGIHPRFRLRCHPVLFKYLSRPLLVEGWDHQVHL